jgi:hypothetical protein
MFLSHTLLADMANDLNLFIRVALVVGIIGFGMTVIASRRKKKR